MGFPTVNTPFTTRSIYGHTARDHYGNERRKSREITMRNTFTKNILTISIKKPFLM